MVSLEGRQGGASRYLRDLETLRARHREIRILCGIEADFYDGNEKYIEEFLARYPFDLVLLTSLLPDQPRSAVVDTVVEGRQRDARLRLDQLYRDGLSAGYVFMMVGRQVRIIAEIIDRRQCSGSAQTASEVAGLPEFALRRATEQARKFDHSRIMTVLEALAAADRSIKTGTCTERIALEQMITDLLPALSHG